MSRAAKLAAELAQTTVLDDDPAYLCRLADLCLRCELYFDASDLFGPLCKSNPDNESLHYRAGTAALKTGQLSAAKRHFQRCIELRPEVAASYLQFGHVFRALRDFDRSADSYLAYLSRSEKEKGNGYWSLADLRNFTFSDKMVHEMQRYLSKCPKLGYEASIMHFALAIAAEQSKDNDLALRHFRLANEIQTTLRPFRSDAYYRLIDGLITADLPPVRIEQDTSSRQIFIVGLPRSGTTLVEQILAAHSQVTATGELPFVERIAFELERSGGYGSRLAALTGRDRNRFRGYLQIMAHWQRLYPESLRVQCYEDLVTNPEKQIAQLLAFCQLESEPSCFEFHLSKQAVLTPSASQVSQPMYTSSIGRWRHYEKSLQPEFEKLAALQDQ